MISSGPGFLNPFHMIRNINSFFALLYLRQRLLSYETGLDGWNLDSVSWFWRYWLMRLFCFVLSSGSCGTIAWFFNCWKCWFKTIQTQSSFLWFRSWKGLALCVIRAPRRKLIIQTIILTSSSTGASSLKESFRLTLAPWKKISWNTSQMMSMARWSAHIQMWQYLWLGCHSCQRVCAASLFTGSTCSIVWWATRAQMKARAQVG